ncbi:MAG: YbaN family protein [Clostridiales Family XIII bacterium]|jgi:uncharacterized membrane protein YbaN (DUF454 family)|nr:YbaN family protein [Clostridiales Family XIII bacterium]
MRGKKILFLTLGFLALGTGAVGVVLPVLPTTPFVLLAAACFGASSPALQQKLERSPFFGDYIRGVRDHVPIPARARAQGIAALWILLSISMLVLREQKITIILLIVGACVTAHLLTIRRK